MIEDDEQATPLEIADELERRIQEQNKLSGRSFMQGDRTSREVMIEHYSNLRGLIDVALDQLKGEDES